MKILLLSAYHASSHKYWCDGLMQHLFEHQWTLLTLPARHFSWRIRGNAMSWAMDYQDILERDYDLLVATSMVDLATLRGLVPKLASIPNLVYFHENQFSYPVRDQAVKSLEPQMVNLYSAMAADGLLFNSNHNRETFLEGCETLLSKMPDCVSEKLPSQLREKSCLLPVPLYEEIFAQGHAPIRLPDSSSAGYTLVWNHRREYDKGPDRLLEFVRLLVDRRENFYLVILGPEFRQSPAEFAEIEALAGSRLLFSGYASSRYEYIQYLRQADFVLSTAMHEFQGLSVAEAVACGCVPLLPRRLAYPEVFPDEYLYKGSINLEVEARNMYRLLRRLRVSNAEAPDISRSSWRYLADRYRNLIKDIGSGVFVGSHHDIPSDSSVSLIQSGRS